ncbi:MAG TPA: hypothetical protein VE992_04430, partial [Solirubrobacteraceae bacterium]|nr:hypothetical protein [Solirubrobacteraceae bacterium]
ALYARRLDALAADPRPPRRTLATDPWPLGEDVDLRLLATPAWRGRDDLGALLRAWSQLTSSATRACLYLLADPAVDGKPAELEARVLEAAAESGAALEDCADINVLMEPSSPERDPRLHAAVGAYLPLHAACAGHVRLARAAGNAVLSLAGARSLSDWLARASLTPLPRAA